MLKPTLREEASHGRLASRRASLGVLALAALLAGTAPARAAESCRAADEFIPLDHADGGGVWIPREVACGGTAPVLVMLHGNNSDHVTHVSVGGGRTLGRLARELIDARRARPVVLVEPVHFRACRSGLYDDDFDFPGYRQMLEQTLAARHVRVASYSVAGHSGAGCCGGVFRAAETFAPLRVFGLVDVCYGDDHYARDVHRLFDDTETTVFHASRGEPIYAHYQAFEQDLLGDAPIEVPCDDEVYRRCLRGPDEPYYSFATVRKDRSYHGEIPTDFYRTLLTRFFPPQPAAAATPVHPAVAPAPGMLESLLGYVLPGGRIPWYKELQRWWRRSSERRTRRSSAAGRAEPNAQLR